MCTVNQYFDSVVRAGIWMWQFCNHSDRSRILDLTEMPIQWHIHLSTAVGAFSAMSAEVLDRSSARSWNTELLSRKVRSCRFWQTPSSTAATGDSLMFNPKKLCIAWLSPKPRCAQVFYFFVFNLSLPCRSAALTALILLCMVLHPSPPSLLFVFFF